VAAGIDSSANRASARCASSATLAATASAEAWRSARSAPAAQRPGKQEEQEHRREPGGQEGQPGEGVRLGLRPGLDLDHADGQAVALHRGGQDEDAARAALDGDLGGAGGALGPLAVAFDGGADLLAEVEDGLFVQRQGPRGGLLPLVLGRRRGLQQAPVELQDADGRDLRMLGGEAGHGAADRLAPFIGGGLRRSLVEGRELVPEAHPAFFGGRGSLRFRRGDLLAEPEPAFRRGLFGGAAARPVHDRGEGGEGHHGLPLGPLPALGRPGPGDEEGPDPHPQQGGDGEAGQEPAAVRGGAGRLGHGVISS
jgi:hypothetical protein